MGEKPFFRNSSPEKKKGRKFNIFRSKEKPTSGEKQKLSRPRNMFSRIKERRARNKEKRSAEDLINSKGFDLGVGNTDKEKDRKEEDENTTKKENEYRKKLKETYDSEMKEMQDQPKEVREAKMGEYLEKYLTEIDIDEKNFNKKDLDNIQDTLPDAYQAAFVSPDMPVGKNFSQIKDSIQRQAKQRVKRDFFKKTRAEYEHEVRREVLKIAGIHHGISDQENFPQCDNKSQKEYEREVEGYRDVIKHAYGETSPEYATVQGPYNPSTGNGIPNYTPMTPGQNSAGESAPYTPGHVEGGQEVKTPGEDFAAWMNLPETKFPENWKGIAEKFMTNKGAESPTTGTPVLLANKSTNRAIFIHKGKWKEFPVIFGSNGFGNGKGQTPIDRVAVFHSVKIANSPEGDASLSGSRTVKGASLLSELGESQGGKWWHGVNPSRLNGGHTLGCVGLDPVLAMEFARAIQDSKNKGYGFVSDAVSPKSPPVGSESMT